MSLEIRQIPLPYAMDALEPHLGARTLHLHYEKHHAGYVRKANQALAEQPRREETLEALVRNTDGFLFHQAAQAWNHDFYWQSMAPDAASRPSGRIAELVARDFGSVDRFKEEFASAAASHFGSGWAWLVLRRDEKLEITTTHDADNPLRHDQRPLLTCDVWEHAYYLDYQNERRRYLQAFLDHLLHWDFANQNLERSGSRP